MGQPELILIPFRKYSSIQKSFKTLSKTISVQKKSIFFSFGEMGGNSRFNRVFAKTKHAVSWAVSAGTFFFRETVSKVSNFSLQKTRAVSPSHKHCRAFRCALRSQTLEPVRNFVGLRFGNYFR
jgi:hypothetical protein